MRIEYNSEASKATLDRYIREGSFSPADLNLHTRAVLQRGEEIQRVSNDLDEIRQYLRSGDVQELRIQVPLKRAGNGNKTSLIDPLDAEEAVLRYDTNKVILRRGDVRTESLKGDEAHDLVNRLMSGDYYYFPAVGKMLAKDLSHEVYMFGKQKSKDDVTEPLEVQVTTSTTWFNNDKFDQGACIRLVRGEGDQPYAEAEQACLDYFSQQPGKEEIASLFGIKINTMKAKRVELMKEYGLELPLLKTPESWVEFLKAWTNHYEHESAKTLVRFKRYHEGREVPRKWVPLRLELTPQDIIQTVRRYNVLVETEFSDGMEESARARYIRDNFLQFKDPGDAQKGRFFILCHERDESKDDKIAELFQIKLGQIQGKKAKAKKG